MYDYDKARIAELRQRFDEEVSTRSRQLSETGREYLEALTAFVDEYNKGPGADPRLVGLDTTGQLNRTEEAVEDAEGERRRVRRILSESA